jgi:phosphoenolpyruvate carboxylase
LAQLVKNTFIKKNEKPNPFDEAVSLIWYLENVFTVRQGIWFITQKNVFHGESIQNALIKLGFWPGGDRDGNPFVTTDITLNVAERLRTLKCYIEIRNLKRKLSVLMFWCPNLNVNFTVLFLF